MLTIAFLLGLKSKPAHPPNLAREQARKRAALRRLLDEIAELDGR